MIHTYNGRNIVPFLPYRQKIVNIKHAINLSNATNTVDVGGAKYTVDMILVRMAPSKLLPY